VCRRTTYKISQEKLSVVSSIHEKNFSDWKWALWEIVKYIGLKWRKWGNDREVLIENGDTRGARLAYLRNIKRYRDASVMPWFRRLVTGFPQRWPGFEPRSRHMKFVVALGQVFSENFGLSCQLSLDRLLHNRHHLSFGASILGPLVGDVPSTVSPHPTPRN
jgi:hypothetical protein